MSNPEASAKTASTVQQLFVAEDGRSVRGLTACSLYKPLDATGGDVWLLDPVGKSDALLVFGDVTGHGESAGMVTGIVSGAVEMARLGMGNALQPFMLATLVGHTLIGTVDAEWLLSAFVARYEPESRKLTFVNGGHPAPRLIRGGTVRALRGNGHPPLGAAKGHRYDQQEEYLAAGDMLVLFSDGFSEASTREGSELGERRIHALCEQYAEGGPPALRNAIFTEVLSHTDDLATLDDDLTLLILTVD